MRNVVGGTQFRVLHRGAEPVGRGDRPAATRRRNRRRAAASAADGQWADRSWFHNRCNGSATERSAYTAFRPVRRGRTGTSNRSTTACGRSASTANHWNTLLEARVVIGDFKHEHNHRHRRSPRRRLRTGPGTPRFRAHQRQPQTPPPLRPPPSYALPCLADAARTDPASRAYSNINARKAKTPPSRHRAGPATTQRPLGLPTPTNPHRGLTTRSRISRGTRH